MSQKRYMAIEKIEQDELQIRFTKLVERQENVLEAVCRQFFPWDEYYQRELMQYILLRLWDYMQEHVNEDERQWERWCPNMAWQVACNYRKSHEYNNNLRMMPLNDSVKDILPNLDDNIIEELERTMDVLRKLNADDYRLVQLYIADIPRVQMARILGMSRRKLQYRISEVKRRLKKLSKEQE